ncbi:MAG: SusC/RagA family TonB-linked outer membrane protein [Spirosomaceae bacterium]|nr:SusC/RagA family TonB-linked outer membrane protein [Spirosomataceae bacterium]
MNKQLRSLLLFFSLLMGATAWAQDRQVSGKVTGDDGTALPGVSVVVKGTNRGVTTAGDGTYKIAVPNTATLVYSFIGFGKKEEAVGNRSTIDVSLVADETLLQEVTVTAFGREAEKKSLGYSVQTIKADAIKAAAEPNILNALQGRVAGAIINSSGGQPGGGTNIILRGITSLGSGADNQPLFVVDGIIISNSTFAGNSLPSAGSNSPGNAEQFSNTNRAADINPDDIESVNILKGAGATALYGQRAANGVVIITTKRGKNGKTQINYGFQTGWDNVLKTPEIQTDYGQGFTGEWRDPAQFRTRTVFWEWGPQKQSYDPLFDNFRTFFRTGTRTNHDLSFSGGNEKAQFYTSFNNFQQKGIVPNSDFRRTSAKVSGNLRATDKLSVASSVNFVNSAGTFQTQGDKSIFSSLSFYSPSFDVNNYLNPDGTENDFSAGVIDNPRFVAEMSGLKNNVNRVIGDVSLNYAFTPWLSAKYQATMDYLTENRNRFVPNTLDVGTQVNGFLVEENRNFRELNSFFFLNATHNFSSDLKGSLMVGNQVTDITGANLWVRGENFVLPGFTDLTNATNFFTAKTRPNSYRQIAAFGEAKLEYKDQLFLTVTGRNDWSSSLPVENRSFFYPSVNLGWVFTEALKLNPSIVSYGKLRASWAQVGKAADPYQLGTYFGQTPGFPFGAVPGFRRSSGVGDITLQPERTTSIEFGLEMAFLKNRLTLDASYFTMDSDKQIFAVQVPVSSGFATYTTNAGLIRNRGIELLLTGKIIDTKDFKWETTVNWSRLRNTVKSMPPSLAEITYFETNNRAALRIVEGGSMGDLYGRDYVRHSSGAVQIGANGFPAVDYSQYKKFGNALPDWQMGISNSVSYKGLSLGFLLDWRQGGTVVDMAELNAIRNGITRMTATRYEQVVFKGVKADGSPNDIPVIIDQNFYRTFAQFPDYQGAIMQDGSWFRVRNASLAYALPKSVLAKTPFSVLRVNLTGNNLFLNTPFRGYDPENLTFGAGDNRIGFVGRNSPSTRSFTVGLNVSFK